MAESDLLMSLLEVIKENPGAVRMFFNAAGSTLAVITDKDHAILACSDNLSRNLHLPEKPLGRFLGDILCALEDGEGFSLLVSRQDNSLLPQIFRVCYTEILFKCYTFELEKGFLVLGDRLGGTDNEVLESMSLLNNELSGMSRQLARKNRELEKANRKIRELSRTDSLTGLANRAYFQERFEQIFALAKRHQAPLAVVMMDLDHFKHINDTYGHDAGDAVLRHFGGLVRESCRQEDFAARFGGEEFILYLPHTIVKEALALADRLRQALAGVNILENQYQVTVSIGVAGMVPDDSPESLIKRADQALYKAKEEGAQLGLRPLKRPGDGKILHRNQLTIFCTADIFYLIIDFFSPL